MSDLDNRLAYTREEAARKCGVSLDTIRRAINKGELRAKRSKAKPDGTPTGKYVVPHAALVEWLNDSLPDA